MDEEKLKNAFSKIKEDIHDLAKELSDIKQHIQENNTLMKQIDDELVRLKLDLITQNTLKNKQIDTSTHNVENTTHPVTSTHPSTVPQEIGGWNTQNSSISIGNGGVSTDRQTDKQTVRQTHFYPEIPQLVTTNPPQTPQIQQKVVTNKINEKTHKPPETPIKQQITEASEILNSLESIKKEIRKKFKSITQQEMLVFSTIFVMEEAEDPDYYKVASKLNLSESSIRDYVQRMINKGIPIEKQKLNNKKIILHISPELKKIASLDTIIKLRDL